MTVVSLGQGILGVETDQRAIETKLFCVIIGHNWNTVSIKKLNGKWVREAQEPGHEGSYVMLRSWSSFDRQPEAREFKHVVWQ